MAVVGKDQKEERRREECNIGRRVNGSKGLAVEAIVPSLAQ
jgi:hypothetical protein